MLYIAYFIIVSGHNIKKKFCKNFPFLTCRGWSLCTHQRPLNHLQTAISKLLGGPWLGLDGPSGHYVGPHGCSSTRIVTKSSPKPIPGATEGFRKKAKFGNLAGVTKQPTQRQFQGFWGGHGSGYMGLAATMRVPMGAQVPVLSLHHHPNPSQGRQKGFRKSPILEILQVSLNSLIQRENG